ncbi:hypothetical protein [Mycobacterium heckeshornense]|uniref:hypothetical protein n=1 Tax=Mycobacterium heckeshornense TaxID=110505 RepID=UPI0006626527|nr:hypothetical protein [Mycobacterium heckeshornense]KMV23299.1 hypothetical protein ACT16_06370 [Mycobacterium heckeshornense]MCV7032811.1 hypothetical protein [Mycobacterium heckeshornense]BCQ08607.1 hypothetical protein JMUB5695_02043 [Mycobacterium heckeshornense]
MRWFVRRLAAVVALMLAPTAAVMIATPGVSSAQCDRNWSRNVWTGECKPPPPVPAWYQAPPPYAPPFAPPDVPPPPPQPQWAPSVGWDPGHQAWGIWEGPVWIPQ